MKTRIREMRRKRGMTLQELAANIRPEPTTAQTIGRLETGVRTVSLDWLARIAEALNCHMADLLELPDRPTIPLIGSVGAQGVVTDDMADSVELAPAAIDPVAVKVSRASGAYAAGDILICDRCEGADIDNAVGQDAVVQTSEGRVLLRRLIRGSKNGRYTLVPLEPGDNVLYDVALDWAAAVKNLYRTVR